MFDAVSGAGDTAFRALGAALAAGRPLAEAAVFAMLAAGVAVAKPGTAVAAPAELMDASRATERGPADAGSRRERDRRRSRRVDGTD